jgi:hypothetical protein
VRISLNLSAFRGAWTAGLLAPGLLLAAIAPGAPAGPRAQFSEMIFDFGKVMPGTKPKHDFIVTNTGRAPLVISAVESGCGCTIAGTWDKEIAPGRTGKIPIQFDPQNFSGKVAKAISVTCNDPVQPTPILEVQANVWRPFEVQPQFVSFMPVDDEPGRETRTVRIVNNVETPAMLELVPSANPRFQVELVTRRPGREFEVRVTYDSGLAEGDPNTIVALRTSNAEQAVLNVTAFAMPQPAVAVIPTAITLPAGRLDARYSFNLVVRNNSGRPLALRDPATNLAGAVVRLSEGEPGKLFYVNLSCPDGFKLPAGAAAVVSVKTSHPKFPEIRVPVVQAEPLSAAENGATVR